MMGSNDKPQNELFYAFNLEYLVPQDHLLRSIDRFLDFTYLREHLAAYHGHTGRPSVDPELMIRMLLIGYCPGIRSERQLCEEIKLNLAYRWFCRLSITDPVPRSCMMKADASRQRHHDGDDWGGGSRAINEYLDALHEDGSSITPAKIVSQTDPMACWTAAPGGPAYYAYSTNCLVDTKAGIIVDLEATTALRNQEVWSTKAMIERVQERFNLKAQKLIGDTAYGTAEFLAWMVEEAGIDHMYQCGTWVIKKLLVLVDPISTTMNRLTATPVREASNYCAAGVITASRVKVFLRMVLSVTGPRCLPRHNHQRFPGTGWTGIDSRPQ